MSSGARPAGTALVRVLLAAADELRAQAPALNRLDGFAGDGDLGITMGKASTALGAALGDGDVEVVPILRKCGVALAAAVPSTSGTLVAMGFLAAAKALTGDQESATGQIAAGFAAATREIRLRGKAARGDKTMLDVLEPVTLRLAAAAQADRSAVEAMAEAAAVAEAATEATRTLIAQAGRAKWMQDRGAGQPDAGCHMLTIAIAKAAAIMSSEAC